MSNALKLNSLENFQGLQDAANDQDATLEFWMPCKRAIAEAPAGKCWKQNNLHMLSENFNSVDRLIEQINRGHEACPNDCPFHSGDGFKPVKEIETIVIKPIRRRTAV
jgi:hypothetical protein